MLKLVQENLNSFIRNQDPIKSLGLGYEAKIRDFFNQYNLSDKNYEIEENGKILFQGNIDLTNLSEDIKMPEYLTIDGYLNLTNSHITELPNNLTVIGGCSLSNTQIKELSNNLIIYGAFILDGTLITKLPEDIIIENTIWVSKNQIELVDFIEQSKFKDKLRY